MNATTVTLDVREEIRRGGDPFSRIMQAVAVLGAKDKLLVTAPFEPKPLFHVMAAKGYAHTAKELPSGDWEVLFERADLAPAPPTRKGRPGEQVEVDARGLEPPQPMVKILEALTSLPQGAVLKARTDRRPIHLAAHLQERGFTGEAEEQDDGSFITTIRHG